MPTIKVKTMFKSCSYMFHKGMTYMVGEEMLQDISEQNYDYFEETEESQAQRTKLVELRDKALACRDTLVKTSGELSHSFKMIDYLSEKNATLSAEVTKLETEYNGWKDGDDRDFNVIVNVGCKK